MGKKEVPEDEGPSDEWLASYADAMTLLLAFFIMMYAFALVDLAKFQDLKIGVAAAFGRENPVTDSTSSVLEDSAGLFTELGYNPVARTEIQEKQDGEKRNDLAEAGEVTPENAEVLRQLLENEFAALGAAELVDVGIDDRGVYIRFDGRVLFAPNDAELDAPGQALLATAADVLKLIDNPLEIEGHTDSQPTGGDWFSNWELSSARASRVVRWLINNGGIPDPQLVAVGRADTRPRGDNSTEEGRAENRRVEIVVRVAGIAESGAATIDPVGDNPVGIDQGASPDAAPPDVLPVDPDAQVSPPEPVADPVTEPLAEPAGEPVADPATGTPPVDGATAPAADGSSGTETVTSEPTPADGEG